MPVRPDPIPQVDITKKYGPSSNLRAVVASAGASDAPFNATHRGGSLEVTPQAETTGHTLEELTARRAEVQKDLETYDEVLKWPVGRQDVEGQRNFVNAQLQRPQAQKELESLNEQIRLKEKEQRSIEDAALVEALKAKYESAPDWQKGEALAELKAAEYNRDWNAMTPLERTGVWLGDRAKRAMYSFNDAVYAIPDLIADVAGIERLQW